jgi:hypothetical protein
MDLVGAWLRQLLRAGTAAAIVPTAMVAALVIVLVGAGGFGGLRSLRQIVAGPEVSPGATAGPRPGDVAPIAPPPARPAVARRVAPPPAPAVAARRVAPIPPPPPARVTPRPPPPPAVEPPPPPPPPPAAAVTPPPAPEQVATPERPALEQTTQQLVDGVDGTLDTVGELLVTIIRRLGRLLPPPRR